MSELKSLPRLLIVDDSRMVRAMLVKNIKGHYDYREEADGEAAWHALLLDQSIKAVISDLTMPVLDGYGLLKRIRNSKVSRIRNLPVIMVSGDEDESSHNHAKELGASDFITKGIGFSELINRINALVYHEAAAETQAVAAAEKIPVTEIPVQSVTKPQEAYPTEEVVYLDLGAASEPVAKDQAVSGAEQTSETVADFDAPATEEIEIVSVPIRTDTTDYSGYQQLPAALSTSGIGVTFKADKIEPTTEEVLRTEKESKPPIAEEHHKVTLQEATGFHAREFIEEKLTQIYEEAVHTKQEVSVLVLGFDNYKELCYKHNEAAINQLIVKFSRLLFGKIRSDDILGNYDEAQLVIISPKTPVRQCLAFGVKIREAIDAANISLSGQSVKLTISAGVASSIADKAVSSAADLMQTAANRMYRVMAAGGNRVLGPEEAQTLRPEMVNLERALFVLEMGKPQALASRALPLAERMMPLLTYLNETLELRLSMTQIWLQLQKKQGDSAEHK